MDRLRGESGNCGIEVRGGGDYRFVGEAADPELVSGLRLLVEKRKGVTGVGEVLTVHSAPDQVMAMLSVDFDDGISARDVERLVCEIEQEAETRYPTVRRLYIRPQSGVIPGVETSC